MSKSSRNNGKFQQNGIIGGFSREVRQRPTGSSAVEMCMKGREKRQEYLEKQRILKENTPRVSPRFLITGR